MPASEGLVDGLGTGGQAALQRGQGKAHRALALVVGQRIRLLPFLCDVIGDGRIEGGLRVGERVIHGRGTAFRKQGRAVELQEVFLDHAAHDVRDVHRVHAVARPAIEPVGVQQGQKELKIGLFAVVRRRRHEEEMARDGAEPFPQLEAPGLVEPVAEVGRGQLVRLVYHHQIPPREAQLGLQVITPGQLVETHQEQIDLVEGIATV